MTLALYHDNIESFLSPYDEQVTRNDLLLREVLFKNLPNIIERITLPARMMAYYFGQKYSEWI